MALNVSENSESSLHDRTSSFHIPAKVEAVTAYLLSEFSEISRAAIAHLFSEFPETKLLRFRISGNWATHFLEIQNLIADNW
jgi:hypothetical protein